MLSRFKMSDAQEEPRYRGRTIIGGSKRRALAGTANLPPRKIRLVSNLLPVSPCKHRQRPNLVAVDAMVDDGELLVATLSRPLCSVIHGKIGVSNTFPQLEYLSDTKYRIEGVYTHRLGNHASTSVTTAFRMSLSCGRFHHSLRLARLRDNFPVHCILINPVFQ
jgi:hypothetical protein